MTFVRSICLYSRYSLNSWATLDTLAQTTLPSVRSRLPSNSHIRDWRRKRKEYQYEVDCISPGSCQWKPGDRQVLRELLRAGIVNRNNWNQWDSVLRVCRCYDRSLLLVKTCRYKDVVGHVQVGTIEPFTSLEYRYLFLSLLSKTNLQCDDPPPRPINQILNILPRCNILKRILRLSKLIHIYHQPINSLTENSVTQ